MDDQLKQIIDRAVADGASDDDIDLLVKEHRTRQQAAAKGPAAPNQKTANPDDFTPKSVTGFVGNAVQDVADMGNAAKSALDPRNWPAMYHAVTAPQQQFADETMKEIAHPSKPAFSEPGDRLAAQLKQIPGMVYAHPINNPAVAAATMLPEAAGVEGFAPGMPSMPAGVRSAAGKVADVVDHPLVAGTIGAVDGLRRGSPTSAVVEGLAGSSAAKGVAKALRKFANGGAAAVEAPHMPTAEGYDAGMPNVSGGVTPGEPQGPMPVAPDAETMAMVDRHMPNQSAASHEGVPNEDHAPAPQAEVDALLDRHMPNKPAASHETVPDEEHAPSQQAGIDAMVDRYMPNESAGSQPADPNASAADYPVADPGEPLASKAPLLDRLAQAMNDKARDEIVTEHAGNAIDRTMKETDTPRIDRNRGVSDLIAENEAAGRSVKEAAHRAAAGTKPSKQLEGDDKIAYGADKLPPRYDISAPTLTNEDLRNALDAIMRQRGGQ